MTRPIRWELIEQREVNSGLNIVEGWHGVNDVIFRKSDELASNRRDQQELAVLSLHLLQAALVYINTLMIHRHPRRPRLGRAPHRRGQARPEYPLFTSNMTPYGEVKVNMTSRLELSDPSPPDPDLDLLAA
jgi:hypothetical protein